MFHFHVSHRTFWSWLLRMLTIFIGIYVGAYFFVPLILSAKTECLDISQNLIYLGSIYLHLKVAPSNISFYTCDWSFLDRICWSSLYLKMQHSSLERDRNGCIFARLRPCGFWCMIFRVRLCWPRLFMRLFIWKCSFLHWNLIEMDVYLLHWDRVAIGQQGISVNCPMEPTFWQSMTHIMCSVFRFFSVISTSLFFPFFLLFTV